MKVSEKPNIENSQIDQDTGLPIDQLREMLLEAKNTPSVEWSVEDIKKRGRELLKNRMK